MIVDFIAADYSRMDYRKKNYADYSDSDSAADSGTVGRTAAGRTAGTADSGRNSAADSGRNVAGEFTNWREVQLNATSNEKVLEWIQYSKLKNLTPIGTGGFGKVYSAEWNEGYTLYWNMKDNKWKRKGVMKVAFRYLINSQILPKFLSEIKNLHKLNRKVSRITRCYGVARHEETNNFMIVMQLIENGNLRGRKVKILYQLSEGLYQIYKAKLVHRDFKHFPFQYLKQMLILKAVV